MDDLVNIMRRIQQEIEAAGINLHLEDDSLHLTGPAGATRLRLVRLYRASSDDVRRAVAPDVLLILTAPTARAIQAAAQYNYILIPGDNYRIVAHGIALVHSVPVAPTAESRQVRLAGRTGVLAESLLLGGRREWSIRDLAADAHVAPALAHRAVTRLECEAILTHHGRGPTMVRVLSNPRALAELWSQEEKMPEPFLRGYLYASSLEALAQKVLDAYPGSAVGGTLAANLYCPVLTRVPPPVRIWAPQDFIPQTLDKIGFQPTDSGANVELYQAKRDPWSVHSQYDGIPRVSRWRAWCEIAKTQGRTHELAEAMFSDLE
jgi:hypothetical protein